MVDIMIRRRRKVTVVVVLMVAVVQVEINMRKVIDRRQHEQTHGTGRGWNDPQVLQTQLVKQNGFFMIPSIHDGWWRMSTSSCSVVVRIGVVITIHTTPTCGRRRTIFFLEDQLMQDQCHVEMDTGPIKGDLNVMFLDFIKGRQVGIGRRQQEVDHGWVAIRIGGRRKQEGTVVNVKLVIFQSRNDHSSGLFGNVILIVVGRVVATAVMVRIMMVIS